MSVKRSFTEISDIMKDLSEHEDWKRDPKTGNPDLGSGKKPIIEVSLDVTDRPYQKKYYMPSDYKNGNVKRFNSKILISNLVMASSQNPLQAFCLKWLSSK